MPREKAEEVLERIDVSARSVGFVEEIKGKSYVTLQGVSSFPSAEAAEVAKNEDENFQEEDRADDTRRTPATPPLVQPRGTALTAAIADDQRRRRVFITHGKSRDLVEPIKKLLEFGELEAVIAVERQSVSKPVPEKVMDDMRRAGAAIIHVDAERTIVDKDGNEHVILNPNVLI